jgi:hypothetical protein
MEETLSDMIKENTEDIEDMENEVKKELHIQKQENIEVVPVMRSVNLIALSEWFMKYKVILKEMGIGFLKLTIADVDPNESLLFTIKHPSNKEHENKKKLRFFDDANKILIPDLKNNSITDLGTGLLISQKFDDNITILNYIGSRSVISTVCCNIEDLIIPIALHKIKRQDQNIEFIDCHKEYIRSILDEKVDKELLQIMYRQSIKAVEKGQIETVREAIKWLVDRREGVNDLNHLLQIDGTIIKITKF